MPDFRPTYGRLQIDASLDPSMSALGRVVLAWLAGWWFCFDYLFSDEKRFSTELLFATGLMTCAAMFPSYVIGIRIRRYPKANRWWCDHWWISWGLIAAALVMMWAAWLPGLRVHGMRHEFPGGPYETYNGWLAVSSWFTLMFGIWHFIPRPRRPPPQYDSYDDEQPSKDHG